MALQTYGILGPVTQKIGNVVGAKWKDRYYFRTLVTPSNPNTASQQAYRAVFTLLVAAGRLILGSVLQSYWDPFYSGMSGFNAFMKYNIQAMDGTHDWAELIIARGSLEGAAISAAAYSGTDVTIDFPTATSGNGEATDAVLAVVFDAENGVAFITDEAVERSDGQQIITVGAGRTVGELKAYLAFHRGTGSSLVVSNSSYFQVTT